MLSLIIPVYKSEEGIERLLAALLDLRRKLPEELEVVLVVDGSPDRSLDLLRSRLPTSELRSRLVVLSRNFGSVAAVRAGLDIGSGDYFAVLAADLQEPPELVIEFLDVLRGRRADIVFGCRTRRADPWLSELLSNSFWHLYRKLVVKDMPKGGVDVFGCTRAVRDQVLQFREVNTNLIALLFWLGFRRHFIGYERRQRREGKSAWTLSKKLQYSLDSIFNFTDLPIQLLLYTGVVGVAVSVIFAIILLIGKLAGGIPVRGYTAIVLTVVFFGALTSLGLGVVGQYLWLGLQNARGRPAFVVSSSEEYCGNGPAPASNGEASRTAGTRRS
jgi:polyisoprenyl-phosphate glycosyltransferase